MRLFTMAVSLAVIAGGAVQADEGRGEAVAAARAPFSEDGIYIAPGESREVVIAGDCRRLSNRDGSIGYYITPSRYDAWPDTAKQEPLEPVVTEAPCR